MKSITYLPLKCLEKEDLAIIYALPSEALPKAYKKWQDKFPTKKFSG